MDKTEIILNTDGSFVERQIRERTLDAGQAVLDTLTDSMTRQVKNVFQVPDWGLVNADVGTNDTLWSIKLDRIPLNARFRLVNRVLLPMFASTTELELPLVWRVPPEITVVFAVLTKRPDQASVSVAGNWLFAGDKDQRVYRLPLPNLHEDCQICTGDFDGRRDTAFACVQASLGQFAQSKWNADLMRTTEQSQKFFRFEPKNDVVETLPVQGEWTALCDKISTVLWERVIV